jgi:hypothetical protein
MPFASFTGDPPEPELIFGKVQTPDPKKADKPRLLGDPQFARMHKMQLQLIQRDQWYLNDEILRLTNLAIFKPFIDAQEWWDKLEQAYWWTTGHKLIRVNKLFLGATDAAGNEWPADKNGDPMIGRSFEDDYRYRGHLYLAGLNGLGIGCVHPKYKNGWLATHKINKEFRVGEGFLTQQVQFRGEDMQDLGLVTNAGHMAIERA